MNRTLAGLATGVVVAASTLPAWGQVVLATFDSYNAVTRQVDALGRFAVRAEASVADQVGTAAGELKVERTTTESNQLVELLEWSLSPSDAQLLVDNPILEIDYRIASGDVNSSTMNIHTVGNNGTFTPWPAVGLTGVNAGIPNSTLRYDLRSDATLYAALQTRAADAGGVGFFVLTQAVAFFNFASPIPAGTTGSLIYREIRAVTVPELLILDEFVTSPPSDLMIQQDGLTSFSLDSGELRAASLALTGTDVGGYEQPVRSRDIGKGFAADFDFLSAGQLLDYPVIELDYRVLESENVQPTSGAVDRFAFDWIPFGDPVPGFYNRYGAFVGQNELWGPSVNAGFRSNGVNDEFVGTFVLDFRQVPSLWGAFTQHFAAGPSGGNTFQLWLNIDRSDDPLGTSGPDEFEQAVVRLRQLRVIKPLTVNAGADKSGTTAVGVALNDAAFTLTPLRSAAKGTSLDVPQPAPTIAWSLVSGPGSANFSSTTVVNPTVTFSAAGDYTLRLTVTEGIATAPKTVSDDVVVTVTAGGDVNPPVLNSVVSRKVHG